MSLFQKTILTGLSPNMTRQDVITALKFLMLPWYWSKLRAGNVSKMVEERLEQYFGVSNAVTCDSGRSALYLVLKALGVGQGDEVLLQGYTCVVVTNAIRFADGVPIYVDVLSDGNMNPEELRKKITTKSKVLIIQHTFGKTADLDSLLAIAKEHNLKVVEDCAHAFGTVYKGKKVGTFGDAAMLSFGSEKVLSCGRGGAVITNNQTLGAKLEELQAALKQSPLHKVLQHLIHYPVFVIGRFLYSFLWIGKLLLFKAKLFHIVHRIIYPPEKRGEQVHGYPSLLPNSLATILLGQLDRIDSLNAHRLAIGKIYERELGQNIGIGENFIPLRYPLFTKNSSIIIRTAKKQEILLGDWYSSVVAPDDATATATQYVIGSCTVAEKLAATSVNLPTDIHITKYDAKIICKLIHPLLAKEGQTPSGDRGGFAM